MIIKLIQDLKGFPYFQNYVNFPFSLTICPNNFHTSYLNIDISDFIKNNQNELNYSLNNNDEESCFKQV